MQSVAHHSKVAASAVLPQPRGSPAVTRPQHKTAALSSKIARVSEIGLGSRALQQSSAQLRCSPVVCAVAEAAPEAEAAGSDIHAQVPLVAREGIRNIAIIAHIDHGKTTMVDAMLKQSNIFRDNQVTSERMMDSNNLERERGITILSKNTAVTYKGCKINIIDTPGHADFGGEVERVLNMCDGVLLLVDSVEGPMPQTRFVLRKALELNKRVVVVVNKIDRPAARPDYVIDTTFDLFVDLGANDQQCDFPVVYASGANGVAGNEPNALADSLEPLFECIVREVAPPSVRLEAPLQMLVTNLDFDDHKGRICIGRVTSGSIRKGEQIVICRPDEVKPRTGKVSELYVYNNFSKMGVDEVQAGDICAFMGVQNVSIGDTICHPEYPAALPTITVEEPTVRMTFLVNTSPFAGKEGKFVTSRNIKERLERELERNLALRVEPGETSDSFIVSGRGALHISILMENMRREGYEFAVGPPTVITKMINDKKCEPYEEALVEVPQEHMGQVVDLLSQRKGQMLEMGTTGEGASATQRVKYRIPTRGLLGLRNAVLTATKGTGVLNTNFLEYAPWAGDIQMREFGSLTAFATGDASSYALLSIETRGKLFIKPGEAIYEGQCIGIHQRTGDLAVNACKRKAATNIRSATKDTTVVLSAPIQMGLDDCLEYCGMDELVEVTPVSVRVRKNPLMAKKGKGA